MCHVGASFDMTSTGQSYTISVRRPEKNVIEMPTVFGGFASYRAEPYESSVGGYWWDLPTVPMPEDGGEYDCEVDFTKSRVVLCPPLSYLDPSAWTGPSAIHPQHVFDHNETFRVAIDVKRGDTLVYRLPFIYRRPPLVLVHGLMGSPLESWLKTDWNPATGANPVPTRIYRVDYADTNTFGYSENYVAAPEKIQEAVDEFRAGGVPIVSGPIPQNTKFAAARVDVVGHSMGGCITRFYIADISDVVSRGPDWAPLAFMRADGVPTWNQPYLRQEKFWGGDIRRFITIGTQFDGSVIADEVEPLVRPTFDTLAAFHVLMNLRAFPEVLGDMLFDDWSPGGNPRPLIYRPPTAVADLCQSSFAQFELENSGIYPLGNKRVRWHPIIGCATDPIGENQIQGVLWEFLFFVVPGLHGGGPEISEVNPTNSDLIVEMSSQQNSGGVFSSLNDDEGTVFNYTIHMAIPGLNGWQVETQSIPIINRVGQLLSGYPSGMGEGVLWP